MKPMSRKLRAFYFYSAIILFVVFVPILALYATGYSFSISQFLKERGGIYVYVPDVSADVYLDGEFQKRTGTFQREMFLQNLKPGSYTVEVKSEEMRSWIKEVEVSEKKVTSLFPFLFPENILIEPVQRFVIKNTSLGTTTATTTKYAEISKLFEEPIEVFDVMDLKEFEKINVLESTTTATTTEEIDKVKFNNMNIWNEEGKIYAEWKDRTDWVPSYFCLNGKCQNPMLVYEAPEEVIHLEFIPWRDDVLIFSTSKQVSIVEVDKREKQLFIPVYEGNKVDFRINGRDLFIKDGQDFYILELEK